MSSSVTAYIDMAAMQHNLQVVKQHAPHQKILAMIKANAYGHQLENAIQGFAEADGFGLARIDEAICVRNLGVDKTILVMSGFYRAEDLPRIAEHDLSVMVHHFLQIELLEQATIERPVKVWLKVNTGMGRLGFLPSEVEAAYQRLQACSQADKPIIFATHFPDADEVAKPITAQQIQEFTHLTKAYSVETSLAKSAAILAFPDSYADWLRPGLMLYGASPFVDKTAAEFNLQPVMTLTAPIISIRQLPQGASVGYGGTWICPEDMPVGVVGIGYGDGYPRHAAAGTPILINGKIAPLIGRVCMDMLMVDLRGHEQVAIGDQAILWGKGLPVEMIAQQANTIAYELLCAVTKRVEFVTH